MPGPDFLEQYKQQLDQYNRDAAAGLDRLYGGIQQFGQQEVQPAQRATTYQDLYKQYYEAPLAKEEEDRRARAASAISGIANLGNVMNSFSNLIFTGQNAPSQTLPTYKGPDIQSFRDKAMNARRIYGDAMIRGVQADDAAYRQDQAREIQLRQWNDQNAARNNDLAFRRYEAQRAADRDALSGAKTVADMEAQQQRWEHQKDMDEARLRIQQNQDARAAEQHSWNRADHQYIEDMRTAARTGKWPDGTKYDPKQVVSETIRGSRSGRSGRSGGSGKGSSYGKYPTIHLKCYSGNTVKGMSRPFDLNDDDDVRAAFNAHIALGTGPSDDLREYDSVDKQRQYLLNYHNHSSRTQNKPITADNNVKNEIFTRRPDNGGKLASPALGGKPTRTTEQESIDW